MELNPIFISGTGAVSPAGWDLEALCSVTRGTESVTPQIVEAPEGLGALWALRVPPAPPRAGGQGSPRMRRAGRISQFAAGASASALEGLGAIGDLGVLFCTTCGGVHYSRRFYGEVLNEPGTASPLLFPETVFNAPASHLSALFGSSAMNYTLSGDSGVFLHGLALAAGWLQENRMERCLVVAAEEVDWIAADALRHFRKSIPLSEGAGAVLLTRERMATTTAALETITDPEPILAAEGRKARAAARQRVVSALPAGPIAFTDPARLGEGFAAGTAWRILAEIEAARHEGRPRAMVCAPGAYQEAIGASFTVFPMKEPA